MIGRASATAVGAERAVNKGILPYSFIEAVGRIVPWAIEGAWITLALSTSWRLGRNWVDRLGMILVRLCYNSDCWYQRSIHG